MKTNKSVTDAINTLNELVELDRYGIQSLIEKKIVCTPELAEHSTCQVSKNNDGYYEVGLLGVINAIFGVDDNSNGFIVASYNEDRKLIGFIELK